MPDMETMRAEENNVFSFPLFNTETLGYRHSLSVEKEMGVVYVPVFYL